MIRTNVIRIHHCIGRRRKGGGTGPGPMTSMAMGPLKRPEDYLLFPNCPCE